MITTPEEPPVRSQHLADLPADQQQQVAQEQAQQQQEQPAEEQIQQPDE